MAFAEIGHPGNAANNDGFGAVDYTYRIGIHEVSVDQFFRATAEDSRIGDGDENYWNDGVRTVGTNAPVGWCNWFEGAHFANWLTSGDAYSGVYQFDTNGVLQAVDREAAMKSYGTIYALPTEDEWYKAAYFRSSTDSYTSYANGSAAGQNPPPRGTTNDWNYAVWTWNTNSGSWDIFTVNDAPDYMWPTDVGGLEQNATRNMNGNAWEWCESAYDGLFNDMSEGHPIRGGGYYENSSYLINSHRHASKAPTFEHEEVGLRIVAVEPFWYRLDVSVSGYGSVNQSNQWVTAGTNLSLVATPDAGSLFMGWGGDLAADYATFSTNLLMNTNKTIIAFFSDDADGDGLLNADEASQGTDPRNADTDGDAMPDGWEVGFTLDPLATNALTDADSDGRTDLYEFALGGDPTNGLDSGIAPYYVMIPEGGTNYFAYLHARRSNAVVLGLSYELELTNDAGSGSWTNSGYSVLGEADLGGGFAAVSNRLDAWSSSNLYLRTAVSTSNAVVYSAVTQITMIDLWAVGYGLSGTNAVPAADPDADGLDNAAEYSAGTNPALADTDADGLNDGEEVNTYGTDPTRTDTDNDTFADGLEVANGGNPIVSDLWRVDHIRNNGLEYDLYSSNSIVDISSGLAVYAVRNGEATLSLQLEKSFDLVSWTNAGDTVYWSIPVGASNIFYRVRATHE